MDSDKDLTQYMTQVNKYPLLTREEEQEIGRKALHCKTKRARKKAQDKLVVSNLRFVVQMAHKYKGYTRSGKLSLLDLVQEGNAGLIKASQKFDPDKGYRFITYAVWWIRAYIQKFLMEQHSLVKIGTTQAQRTLFFKMGSIREMIEINDPDLKAEMREQLATDYKVSVKDIMEMEKRVQANDFSLNATMGSDDQNNTFQDMLSDSSVVIDQIEDKNMLRYLKDQIIGAMSDLSKREKDIISTRWLTDEKVTLAAIGERYGISRERVRQIEAKAFNKMRAKLHKNGATLKELY